MWLGSSCRLQRWPILKKRNDAVTAHLRIIMSRVGLQLKASLRNSNSWKLNMCNESDIVSVYVCINGPELEGEICRGKAALTEEVLSLSAGKTVCFRLLNLSISQPSTAPQSSSSCSDLTRQSAQRRRGTAAAHPLERRLVLVFLSGSLGCLTPVTPV